MRKRPFHVVAFVFSLIFALTAGSALAAAILADWSACLPLFLKVTPIEYRRALARMKQSEGPQAESIAATEEVYHA